MNKIVILLIIQAFLVISCADVCEHESDLKSAYKTVTTCAAGDSCKAYVRVGDGCSYDFTPWEACGVIAINENYDVFAEAQKLDRLHRLACDGCFSKVAQCASCVEPVAVRSTCDATTGRCTVELADDCRDDADCPYGRVCCPETEVCSLLEDCASRVEEDDSEEE